MKIRLFVVAAIVVLLLAMATVTHAQASTLEFMEQALSVKTWNALGWLSKDYGVFTVGCECYGGIYGNLSVGGFAATENSTVFFDAALGNACTLTFEAGAYDAVKAELVERYGEPQADADADPAALTWSFQQAEIRLVYPHDGELALIYTARVSPFLSRPTFQPTQTPAPTPTRDPQAAKRSQENTFAFMEQASVADSWEALLELMQQYDLNGYVTGCYADITGDLSIGGATAEVVMIICGGNEGTTVYETAGYEYDIWFDSEAYDAVHEALVARYGEPEMIDDPDSPTLVWSFRQTEVCLYYVYSDRIIVTYRLQPTADEAKPTFPLAQTVRATPAPTQAEVDSSPDADNFIAFMEQASQAYSRKELGKITSGYGLTAEENERGAGVSGSLTVGGHAALRVDVCTPEGLPGFDCYAYFEPDAYDALKAALISHYGEPLTMRGTRDGVVWPFAEIDISLSRSVAGMVEVCYDALTFHNGFYLSFPPLAKAEVPIRDQTQVITYAEANTLEFMEQALLVDSWKALGDLGARYKITAVNESRNTIGGNLSIAGFSATVGTAYDYNLPGYNCNLEFESDAYDAVLEALVNRYGDPRIEWTYQPTLTWDFRDASVNLCRSSYDGELTLYYSSGESPDESLPTFPPAQADTSTTAP